MGYCLDITPNSQDSQQRNVWSSLRRIIFQILGVKGLKTFLFQESSQNKQASKQEVDLADYIIYAVVHTSTVHCKQPPIVQCF